jgi:CRP-like cAMP-binding protein
MAIDDDILLFTKVSLFQGFAPEHLRLLAFGSEHLALRAGRDLYRESQVADCGFIVASGDIELHSETESGRQSHGRYQRGALLGELAMIAPGRRPCHATATVESEVIRISRAAFMRILNEYPDVARRLHSRIAGDLGALVEKVARLGPSFLE